MDPHEYLSALQKRWVFILVLTLLGGVGGYAYASSMTDMYKATSSVFVSTPQGATTSELLQGSTYTQNLVQSYAQLATMPAVLEPVIHRLGLATTPHNLASSITADIPLNTVIVQVSVTNPSARQSARIANAVAQSLSSVASGLSPRGSDGKATIRMSITAPAEVPSSPIAPKSKLITLSGLAVGLLLGMIYAVARELLDTRIRIASDVRYCGDVDVLGSVVKRRRSEPEGISMLVAPHGVVAEGYRRLRTNLEFSEVDRDLHSLTVTSAVSGEGKSTVCVNLALAMAERAQRILIVDGDLRNPSLAEYCGLEGAVGLTTVLSNRVALDDAIQQLNDLVDVLPSGVIPPNPSQLLGSNAMRELLTEVGARYDIVILDSPPVLPAADALALSHLTDGTIVVALHNKTRRQQLARVLSDLNTVNSRVLSVVINQAKREHHDEYYNYVHGESIKHEMPRRVAARPSRPARRAKRASSAELMQPAVVTEVMALPETTVPNGGVSLLEVPTAATPLSLAKLVDRNERKRREPVPSSHAANSDYKSIQQSPRNSTQDDDAKTVVITSSTARVARD